MMTLAAVADVVLADSSGAQDVPFAIMAVPADAVPVAMAKVIPEAAVARTVPAIKVTVVGRACAKRMKRPYLCCSLLLRNDSFSMGCCFMRRAGPAICRDMPFRTSDPVPHATRLPHGATGLITVARRIVNLRMRNVAYSIHIVALNVRSVILPGP